MTTDGSGQFELNLINAPITEAAKAVLGDALHLNYIVDPRVQGTVTLQTSQPVSKDALVDILQSALAVNGAGITSRAGTYQVVPLSEIMSGTPPVSVPSVSPSGPGVKVQVLQLQFIAADEMKTILEPITRQGSVLRVDSTRNLITVARKDSELSAIRAEEAWPSPEALHRSTINGAIDGIVGTSGLSDTASSRLRLANDQCRIYRIPYAEPPRRVPALLRAVVSSTLAAKGHLSVSGADDGLQFGRLFSPS
ncbi:hypothetical protein [Mesorhizobium sp. M0088]|uniref:hypothetical protein n=1 Tax=Mesorhizobium sp. M0088 TaxID=2956873 RepID=UPI00333CE4AB